MAIVFDVSNEIALFVYTDNVEKVSMSLKSGIARPQINNEIDMTIKETRTIVVRWSFDAWRFFHLSGDDCKTDTANDKRPRAK